MLKTNKKCVLLLFLVRYFNDSESYNKKKKNNLAFQIFDFENDYFKWEQNDVLCSY